MTCTCAVEGCSKPVFRRDLCSAHERRNRLYGDPLGKAPSYSQQLKWLLANADYGGDDCLRWPFCILPDGRGHCNFRGTSMKAARAMCIVAHGEPPPSDERMEAAHSCGNGHLGCVNPRHIRWLTVTQNQRERIVHGTSNRGEKHGFSKLTEAEVRRIRNLQGQVSAREVARQFGIAHAQVRNIQTGRQWGWLE